MQINRWNQVLLTINALILIGNSVCSVWFVKKYQHLYEPPLNQRFYEARLNMLYRMLHHAKDPDSIRHMISYTEYVFQTPSEMISAHEIADLEERYVSAVRDWSIQRWLEETKVSPVPKYAEKEVKDLLLIQLSMLSEESRFSQIEDKRQNSRKTRKLDTWQVRKHERALERLEGEGLTIDELIDCCRHAALINHRQVNARSEAP